MIIQATIKCDECGTIETFDAQGLERSDAKGWLFSEAVDLCPPCLKRQNDIASGKFSA